MGYVAQQQLDSYNKASAHADNHKTTFDRRVIKKGRVTTFERGQLVQVYRSDLANTLSTARKIEPTWTGPWRVTERLLNSYTLESLDGEPLRGEYNARRLREFVPQDGTELTLEQKNFEMALKQKEQEMAVIEQSGLITDGEEEEETFEDEPENTDECDEALVGDRDVT